jgi:hypothetical protein
MTILIFTTPLQVIQIPRIKFQKFRCINSMDQTWLSWYPKWNTTSPSRIFRIMRPKYMWGLFTFIKNDGNGGNGTRNSI